jgi:DnaJ-class molecular chaperone
LKWTDLTQSGGDAFLKQISQLPATEILGVSPDASDAQLVAAYRRLASRYHPDRVDAFMKPYAGRMLAIINTAYDMERTRRGI